MRRRQWLAVLAALFAVAVLASACAGQSAVGGAEPSLTTLSFRAEAVRAVVVGWDPTLDRVPSPKRTTDRRAFAPLLEALSRVSERANPPDLLGPPVHLTVELSGGKTRRFELWSPYLADKESNLLYFLPDGILGALRSAMEPLLPRPIAAPAQISGMTTVAGLVRALQEHGARDAKETGEELRALLFGARSGRVIEVLGQKVQVYTMANPDAATRAAALDPSEMTVEWVAKPHFVAVGNLLVTVVLPEQEMATKIVAYLQMVRA